MGRLPQPPAAKATAVEDLPTWPPGRSPATRSRADRLATRSLANRLATPQAQPAQFGGGLDLANLANMAAFASGPSRGSYGYGLAAQAGATRDVGLAGADVSQYLGELGFLGQALQGAYGPAVAAQQTVPGAQAAMFGAGQQTEQARLAAQSQMFGAQQATLGPYYGAQAQVTRAPYELMGALGPAAMQTTTAQNIQQMQNEAQYNRLAAVLAQFGQMPGVGGITTDYGASVGLA